jgi:hypothetical protein
LALQLAQSRLVPSSGLATILILGDLGASLG